MNSSHRTGLLLVLAFIVSLPAVTPRIYAADEVEYFSFLRSLWFDRDLSFDNEYRHFEQAAGPRMPGFRQTFLDQATTTGLRRNFGTIGAALLWAPFYAVADVAVHVARAFGANVTADGYSKPYLTAVAVGSAVYGFLAVMLSAWACGLIFGPQRSRWLAVTAAWAGTPLLFYMYVAPPFAHAASAFAVAAFVVTWLRVRQRWSLPGLAALGALAALMAMVREQDALFAAGPALDFAWTIFERARTRAGTRAAFGLVGNAVAGAGVAAVAFAPQAISYITLNGRLGPDGLVTRKMTWTAPHAWQVLASPEHGFLFWTPVAALALAGLLLMLRDRSRLAICLLVMVALQVYVAGAIESWTVAGAFGQRRFVGLTIVLVIGLAALLVAARRAALRRLAVAAIVVAAWWNIALMVQFATGSMDRQRLALGTNAYNAFLVVPREIPRIVYRYAFDRSSFYAAPGH